MGRGRGSGRTGRGSGRGSNIQRLEIAEEDETPVEEDKESPRIQEIEEDTDTDNSPPIIKDVDSDEEDLPVDGNSNPVNASPILLDLDGSSRNHSHSNSQIVATVNRGEDSRSEDTALKPSILRKRRPEEGARMGEEWEGGGGVSGRQGTEVSRRVAASV
eukprot:scaffold36307_cov124-Isochrysis_galbana.AAC.2